MIHSAAGLYEDLAFLAYHFHWSQDEILDLEHATRTRYVQEIVRLDGGRARSR